MPHSLQRESLTLHSERKRKKLRNENIAQMKKGEMERVLERENRNRKTGRGCYRLHPKPQCKGIDISPTHPNGEAQRILPSHLRAFEKVRREEERERERERKREKERERENLCQRRPRGSWNHQDVRLRKKMTSHSNTQTHTHRYRYTPAKEDRSYTRPSMMTHMSCVC